ncbi:MAG: hypothetical protein AB1713_04125 [Pseudomonadota bacterium]
MSRRSHRPSFRMPPLITEHRPEPARQASSRGFSIIAVIAILLVLAGLGAVMAQLATTQHLGLTMAQDGRQAYYAARAGLEWGRRRVQDSLCTPSSTFNIEDFAVTVNCVAGPTVTEGSTMLTSYNLTSTASLHAGVFGTVSRELRMAVWR